MTDRDFPALNATTAKLTYGWVSPLNDRPAKKDEAFPRMLRRGDAWKARLPMACLGEPLDPSGGCWRCAGTAHELLLGVGEKCPRGR